LVGVTFWLLERPTDTWPVVAAMAAALLVLLTVPGLLLLGVPLPARMPKKLEGVRDALRLAASLPVGTLGRVGGLAVLAQLLGIGSYGLVALAIGLDLSWITIAWTRSAAMLLAILPVSVAGLGLREGALVLLLAPYGVTPADAMAFSLTAFASTTLAAGLLGGLFEARRLLSGAPEAEPAGHRSSSSPDGAKARRAAR
jgi:glycosyltransferase 2 family protein